MLDPAENGFGLASFSSRGPTQDNRMKPDIGAPGVNIMSVRANSGNQYVSYSGTSMATPFVSGTIALMLDANPGLTVSQVRTILQSTAVPWGPNGQDVDYGWGRLDGYAAVKAAAGGSGGNGPAVPGHVTFSGSITAAGGRAEHTFTVNDASHPVCVTMIMPNWSGSNNPDFDLYVFHPDGSEVGRATGSSRQEQVARDVIQTGQYKVEVRSYAGTGAYLIDVSAGLGQATDQPPAVTFTEPAEGATVSGTAMVRMTATDDQGVSKVEVAVDSGSYTDITGSRSGSTFSWPWNTTGAANGPHTLRARATDTAGQTATATRQVTVNNGQEPPPGGDQTITRTGRVTAAVRDVNVEFAVTAAGYVDLSLTWNTNADLDFYVYAPDGTFVGRAYTTRKPETMRVDTVRWGTGTYRVRVNLYGGADSNFTLTAAGFKETSYTGTVSSSARDANHQQTLAYTGQGRVTLAWSGSSDLDFFVYDPAGTERARAYTLNNPEAVDVNFTAVGAWRVRVNLYSGAGGTYALKIAAPDAVFG
jgi:hypothetical protein